MAIDREWEGLLVELGRFRRGVLGVSAGLKFMPRPRLVPGACKAATLEMCPTRIVLQTFLIKNIARFLALRSLQK